MHLDRAATARRNKLSTRADAKGGEDPQTHGRGVDVFRRLILAQALTQAADGLVQAGLADLLLLEPLAQDTPGRVLRLFLVTLLPYSLLSPFMGVLVDRWSRRSIMVASSSGRAAIAAVLVLAPSALAYEGILLVAALAVLGLGRLWLTTKGAVLPSVAGPRELVAANSMSAGAGMISALAGGAIGIGAAGAGGARLALFTGLLVYAAAAIASARIIVPTHPQLRHRRLLSALRDVAADLVVGIRHIARHAEAALSLSGIFVVRTTTMFGAFTALVLIKARFPEQGERAGRLSLVALALGAAGAGALLGALTGGALAAKLPRHRLLIAGFGTVGAATLLLATSRHPVTILAATMVGGYGAFIAKVAVDALLQSSLADRYRGRAFALYDIAFNLASVAAGFLLVLVASIPPERSLAGVAVVTWLAGGAFLAGFRRAGNRAA